MQESPDSERQAMVAALVEALGEARFAYVFGSLLGDAFGPESDIDVAADFGAPLHREARLDLIERVGAATGCELDLIDLFTADPIIRMQVLRYGKVFVDRDPSARHRFEARVLGEYMDFKIDRAPVEAAMRERHGS